MAFKGCFSFILFSLLQFVSLGVGKEELKFSEYIPKNVEELHRLSVAMNCVFQNYGNSTEIQECMSCFFPFETSSIKCYDRFFSSEDKKESCKFPKIAEINDENREEVMFNLTSCVDYNLRLNTIESCVQTSLLSHHHELVKVVNLIDSCTVKNINAVFEKAINELEASNIGSVNANCEDVLEQINYFEIVSKCEEVTDGKTEECKKCLKGAFDLEGGDIPQVFEKALFCSNKHLNPVFGKCFNSENFSSKSFTKVYGVKKAIGNCLHKNTNSVLQNICMYNLPGQFINSPEPAEVYSLVSACMDYHHIRLHKIHYDEALKAKLVLNENYIRAMDGITVEVQEFFDKITVRNAK